MKRSRCAVLLLIIAALLFGGCSSSDSSPTPAEQPPVEQPPGEQPPVEEPPVIITSISQVGVIETGSATDVVAYGDYLYYVGYLPGASFGIVDFRDPRNPSILPTSTMNVGEAWGVAFDGRYAYVETEGRGEGIFSGRTLGVIDCLDPSAPEAVMDNAEGSYLAGDVEIRGNYLYNLSDSIIGVYDVSDPRELKWLRNLETSGGTEFGKLLGDYLYVTDLEGLLIFDISDPAAVPEPVRLPIPSNGSGAAATATTAFVAGEEGGVPYIYAIDVSSPASPSIIGQIATPSKLQFEMRVLGNYLLANGYEHFAVIDISDPEQMTVVGVPVALDNGWGGFDVSGRHAIVNDDTRFRIIELY